MWWLFGYVVHLIKAREQPLGLKWSVWEVSHPKWSCEQKPPLLLYGAFTHSVDGLTGLVVVTMLIKERTTGLALWRCDKAALGGCGQCGAGFCFFIVMLLLRYC